MGAIDFQKQMIDTVYVNLPGPQEPEPGMTGPQLLHGFLAELKSSTDPQIKLYLADLCEKWSVIYRHKKD